MLLKIFKKIGRALVGEIDPIFLNIRQTKDYFLNEINLINVWAYVFLCDAFCQPFVFSS